MSNRTGVTRRLDNKCVYCLADLKHPTNKFCGQSCITAWVNKRRTVNIENRFWALVNKDGPVHPTLKTKCWLWQAKPWNQFGHGRIQFQNRRVIGAHRFSWELHKEPIPKGKSVLHKCDVPQCVNPDHLFIGTQLENMRDRRAKGR